jgi:hypothetical protein
MSSCSSWSMYNFIMCVRGVFLRAVCDAQGAWHRTAYRSKTLRPQLGSSLHLWLNLGSCQRNDYLRDYHLRNDYHLRQLPHVNRYMQW